MLRSFWYFGIVLFSFISAPAICQTNLLLNGDFKDINLCSEFKADCGVEAWFYLKDVKVQIIPNNSAKDAGANSFAIFYNWAGNTGFTPIVGTILPCYLQKGKEYIFKGRIAAKLHPQLLLTPGICTGEFFYVPRRPFAAAMKPDSITKLTKIPETPFFQFQYRFIATGDERYLTFGTFVKEDETSTKKITELEEVALMLQDFSLNTTDPAETKCDAYDDQKEKIYHYDFRHKEMDYTLYGKGKLPIQLDQNKENLTTGVAKPSPPVKPDTLKLGDVLFDFNQADLKTETAKMLEKFFKNKDDKRPIDSIYIEGHTDSIGSDQKNMQLSRQRSESVKNWLIGNNIVSSNEVALHPFGRSRPVALNNTPAGRALNRRVEIIVFRGRGK